MTKITLDRLDSIDAIIEQLINKELIGVKNLARNGFIGTGYLAQVRDDIDYLRETREQLLAG